MFTIISEGSYMFDAKVLRDSGWILSIGLKMMMVSMMTRFTDGGWSLSNGG